MATYRVWLTVKDRYGNTKELDGGIIKAELNPLTDEDIAIIDEHFTTEAEVTSAVDKSSETIKYSGFEFEDGEEVTG